MGENGFPAELTRLSAGAAEKLRPGRRPAGGASTTTAAERRPRFLPAIVALTLLGALLGGCGEDRVEAPGAGGVGAVMINEP